MMSFAAGFPNLAHDSVGAAGIGTRAARQCAIQIVDHDPGAFLHQQHRFAAPMSRPAPVTMATLPYGPFLPCDI